MSPLLLMAVAQSEQLDGPTSDVRATGQSTPEDLDDIDNLGGLPDRFASPGQQARQAFSNQTNGAAPVTPRPHGQRQRWVGRKVWTPIDSRKATRIDIGAIFLTGCTSNERLLGSPEDL